MCKSKNDVEHIEQNARISLCALQTPLYGCYHIFTPLLVQGISASLNYYTSLNVTCPIFSVFKIDKFEAVVNTALYTLYSFFIHSLYTLYTLFIRSLYTLYTLFMHSLYTLHTLFIHFIHSLYALYTLFIHSCRYFIHSVLYSYIFFFTFISTLYYTININNNLYPN